MTSEGQYAGSQPAESTSGGPSSEGFRPDSDAQRAAGRASAPPPADGFPSSYAPPPQATPNGGSPFVVPAVSTFGPGSEGSPGGRPAPQAGASYGSARVPQPDDNGSLPQRTASPYGSVSPGGSPYGQPDEARSAWAPQTPPEPAGPEGPFGRRPEPLPQRNASVPVDPTGDFDGFAAGSPGRGQVPDAPSGRDEVDPATGRPPGLSAFGAQRVRVPGATLADLPDTTPPSARSGDSGGFPVRPADDGALPARFDNGGLPVRSPETSAPDSAAPGRAVDSGGFPLRSGGNGSFPTRRGDSSGFPLRGATGAEPDASASGDELPVRSQQGPFGPPSGSPFGSAPPESPSGSYSPFGPAADESHPYGRPADSATEDPFGRLTLGEPAPGASAPGTPSSGGPFGRPPAGEPASRLPGSPHDASDQQSGGFPAQPSSRFPGQPADGQSSGGFPSPPLSRQPGQSAEAQPSGGFPAQPSSRFPGQPADSQPSGGFPAQPSSRFPEQSAEGSSGQPSGGFPAQPAGRFPPPSGGFPAPPSGDGPVQPFGARPDFPAPPRSADDDAHAPYRRPEPPADPEQSRFSGEAPPPGSSYPQRVPGAALGAIGGPGAAEFRDASESRHGAVPQPRDPEPQSAPAVGSARPVTGSASVPTASRVAPVEPGELPPPAAAPQARVYGRPAPVESGNDDADEARAESEGRSDGRDAAPQSPAFPGRPADDRPASGGFGPPLFATPPLTGDFGYPGPDDQDGSDQPAFPGQRGGDPNAAGGFGSPAYPSRSTADPVGEPAPPARATARASASARVSPPPPPEQQPHNDALFTEFTTDVAGRGNPAPGRPGGFPAGDQGDRPGGGFPVDDQADRPGGGFPVADQGSRPGGGFPVADQGSRPGGFPQPDGGRSGGFAPPEQGGRAGGFPPADGNRPGGFPPAGSNGNGGFPPAEGDRPGGFPPADGNRPGGFPPADGNRPGGFPPPEQGGRPGGFSPADQGNRPGGGFPVADPGNRPGGGFPVADQGSRSGGFAPPEQYGEHTSDISGRGPDQPYVPAPALPSMPPGFESTDGGNARMGGLFPGPATRGTVTPPPGPDETASWPGPAEQGRFDQFKPEADAAPAKPETPHVRMLPVLLSVVVGAALLVGLAFGIVYLVAGGGDDSKSFSVSQGDCVKKSGDAAVKADCGDATSFEVVSIVDDKTKCADVKQPYVVNPTSDGKTQVLCLKPHS